MSLLEVCNMAMRAELLTQEKFKSKAPRISYYNNNYLPTLEKIKSATDNTTYKFKKKEGSEEAKTERSSRERCT